MQAGDATIEQTAPPAPALRWLKALRAYSFPASLAPVAVGVAAVHYAGVAVDWWTVPFTALTALLIHIGTNLINDVVDFEQGVDAGESMGGSGVLLDRWLSPKQIRFAAVFSFILAGVVGAPVLIARGWPLLMIGLIGVVGGYFYTAPPVSFKYRALGDPVVFLLCGPLLVIGVAVAVSGYAPIEAILAGLPVGGIVTGLLVANNLRDVAEDSKRNVRTLASIIGETATKVEYVFLVAGAFAAVFVLSALGVFPVWTLLTLLAIPAAVGPIMDVIHNRVADQAVERTAKLHLVFGVLFTIGLFLA